MRVLIPPAAVTEDGIAVVWEKPNDADKVKEYRALLNDREMARVTETDYTFQHLEPDTEYIVQIYASSADDKIISISDKVKGRTKKRPEVLDITNYGAVDDGQTINTRAIQTAIDVCPENGTVYIPKGIFISGAIFLKSSMTLYVEEGGMLLGSIQPEDYPLMTYRYEGKELLCYASLVNTKTESGRLHDITIVGGGVIDGNGNALILKELEEKKGKRGCVVCLRNTDWVYMKDVTVCQSAFWCVHMIYCSHISMNHVEIYTKYDKQGNRYDNIVNGDGFDPDSCNDVYLFHSFISSEDDCVAVKSGRDEEGRKIGIPSENIHITNCRFKNGFGVAMGSEMAGGIRNILVQDCRFEDSFSIGSVKAPRGRGSYIENVVYDNCHLVNNNREIKSCKWFRGAIYIDNYYGQDEYDPEKFMLVGEGTPVIQNITFRNIFIDSKEGYAIYLMGLPESPARQIRLEHIKARGRNGFYAVNVDGLILKDVSVTALEGDDIKMKNAKHVEIIVSLQ